MARKTALASAPAVDAPTLPAPRQLIVCERLEHPAGDGRVWEIGSIIPWDALTAASITILLERQIIGIYLAPEQIAALPLDAQ